MAEPMIVEMVNVQNWQGITRYQQVSLSACPIGFDKHVTYSAIKVSKTAIEIPNLQNCGCNENGDQYPEDWIF